MQSFFRLINFLAAWSSSRVESFGAQYFTFGVFGLVNYPLAFFILYYFQSQEQESFLLRLMACLACTPLVLHRQLPSTLKRFLPLYWHVTLLYSIPFFATVMLLRNQFSIEWLLNMLLGIFLFILLVDWLTFLVLLVLGAFLGFLFFAATGGTPQFTLYNSMSSSLSLIVYLYCYAVIIGALFARNREKIYEAKLQTVKNLAYSIAHEMRTPLACVSLNAGSLGKILPIYENAFEKAREAGVVVSNIHPKHHVHLRELAHTMERVSHNAQNIINMLLMKVRDVQSVELEERSIGTCIQLALEQYPLTVEERKRVFWDKSNDFFVLCKEEMFLHIIFNLLKNSVYQIAHVKGGTIKIWTEIGDKSNFLHFKDNGRGISKKLLAKIFDRFVTGTGLGTGMGLAYCKMAMLSFGGDIDCISEKGNGAEFILRFPKIIPDRRGIS